MEGEEAVDPSEEMASDFPSDSPSDIATAETLSSDYPSDFASDAPSDVATMPSMMPTNFEPLLDWSTENAAAEDYYDNPANDINDRGAGTSSITDGDVRAAGTVSSISPAAAVGMAVCGTLVVAAVAILGRSQRGLALGRMVMGDNSFWSTPGRQAPPTPLAAADEMTFDDGSSHHGDVVRGDAEVGFGAPVDLDAEGAEEQDGDVAETSATQEQLEEALQEMEKEALSPRAKAPAGIETV